MPQIKKIIILSIVSILILYLLNRKKKQYTYNFIQQREDTCHLCSWYNFNIVKAIRKNTKIRFGYIRAIRGSKSNFLGTPI